MKDFRLTGESFPILVENIKSLLINTQKPYRVTVVEWRDKRTLSQNSMYWAWLAEIDKRNPLRVDGVDMQGGEIWHEVFKKYYCPEKTISNGSASMPIKSTKLLDTGEMTFYLNKIESWCMDRGIKLTIPETSEYYQLMESQLR